MRNGDGAPRICVNVCFYSSDRADLKVGDLVYSIDRGSLVVVPIKRVHRQPVTGSHRIVELKLAHGATLRTVRAIRRLTVAILPTSGPVTSSTAFV